MSVASLPSAPPPGLSPVRSEEPRGLRLATLVRLRWLAVAGQLGSTLVACLAFGFALPLWSCLALIGASAMLNLALDRVFPASYRPSPAAAAALLAYDLAQLAALLHLAGGLQNPFALLFLAPVTASATSLPPRHSLALGLFMVALAALLVVIGRPMPWFFGASLELPVFYQWSAWLALVIGAAFTGVYSSRLAREALQLSEALAAADLTLARQAHLAQLDGLAAAAAHELGTPLGTIRLVTGEWLRGEPPSGEDVALVHEQAARCRAILERLSTMRSDPMLERVTLAQLVEEALAPHRGAGVAIEADLSGEGPEPLFTRHPGLAYGLGTLVENAVDFAAAQVRVEGRWSQEGVRLAVIDDGPGFPADVLRQIGDPYLRSAHEGRRAKAEGGLGLGLFIAKTLLERAGARLSIGNAPGGGAVARLAWSAARLAPGAGMQPLRVNAQGL